MRRFALAVAAASPILIWGVARAGNDAGANVAIRFTAPSTYSFSTAPRQVSGSNMVLTPAALNPGQIEVSQLIDPNTGRLKSASIRVEFQGICNGLHAFSLMTSRGGLVALEDGTVTRSFKPIHYRAEAQWSGKTVALETDSTPGKGSDVGLVGGPSRGSLIVTVAIDGTTNDMSAPLSEGNYLDTLIVRIRPPL